jgi:uncharacterized phage-associated protein
MSIVDFILTKPGMRKIPAASMSHLVWFCDGWHLAIHGTRMCSEPAQASHLGPCYPAVSEGLNYRHVMRELGGKPAPHAPLTPQQREIVEHVLARYARLPAPDLRMACARPGAGAWWSVYGAEDGLNSTIPTATMKAEFEDLARRSRETRAAA